jgi:hypothetical protein
VFDGAFSEYQEVPASRVFPIKEFDPNYIGLLVSGMTAKLALDDLGELDKFSTKKQNILTTAAAGGTGHLFTQLAKIKNPKNNFVVGTTSTQEKADWMEEFGTVDQAINLNESENFNFNKKLKEKGLKHKDFVFEGGGGSAIVGWFLSREAVTTSSRNSPRKAV